MLKRPYALLDRRRSWRGRPKQWGGRSRKEVAAPEFTALNPKPPVHVIKGIIIHNCAAVLVAQRLDRILVGVLRAGARPNLHHQHGLRLNHVPRFRASHSRNATHFSVLQIVKYPTGLRRNGTS